MRLAAAPFALLVLVSAASCTSIMGLPDVPTPVEAGDDGSSGAGSSGTGSGSSGSSSSSASSTSSTSSSGASSGTDSGSDGTVGTEAGGDGAGSSASSSSGSSEGGSSSSGSGSGSGSSSGSACTSTTEDCFNGVDDNCDGKVDCGDPQCIGGTSPIAECVPDPGALAAGVLQTGACSPTYPNATPLYSGLVPGMCKTGTCNCNSGYSGTATCSTSLTLKGASVGSCNLASGTTIFSNTSADGCIPFSTLNAASYYQLATPTLNGTCAAPGAGSVAGKVAPLWSTTDNFCTSPKVGAGCGPGKVCVPAAVNHCVLEVGALACQNSAYQTATSLFSGFDDSDTSHSCACSCTGSCSTVVGFASGSCGAGLFAVGAGCQKNLAYDHAQVSAPLACVAGFTETGATSTAAFERTVCCLH